MILVNNLRTWSDAPRFRQLVHAHGDGCTLADLIFPFFLFIVGVTTVISLDRRVRKGRVARGFIRLSLSVPASSFSWAW